jgi:transposase InsO family protein
VTAERDTDAGAVPVIRACELTSVSRSWYYDRQRRVPRDDTALQDEIEKIVVECAGYGYRRVTRELERRGQIANHKRVLRIMRDKSWLCRLQRRSRRTTLSDHGLAVFPNLLKEAVITGLNQAWVADITYIRLPTEFIFLAAILDAHSRKVIGWNLSRRLDVSLSLTALECALAKRQVAPGVIHHSDQGVQYAAGDYVAKAREAGMLLSMSRRGQPTDNPQAESFFRTLKTEQVYLSEYLDFDDAHRQIGHFIEDVYNEKRLHSAIGYVPPAEFEAGIALAQKERDRPASGYAAPHTATATATAQPTPVRARTC